MSNHASSISDYLASTQAVLQAGRRLRSALGADAAAREFAVARLERAAQQQDAGAGAYRAFMFAELQGSAAADIPKRERLTEDTLATVLNDLQVANVLMAAGQVVGETGEKAGRQVLDDALRRLENTSNTVERALDTPLVAGVEAGRFGFSEKPAEKVESASLEAARDTFKSRAAAAMNDLVKDSLEVITGVVTALSKIDQQKVAEALQSLGGQVQELPRLGRLFRQGIEKLQSAIDALLRLLGSDALERIKAEVEKIWVDVKEGKHVEAALKMILGVAATEAQINKAAGDLTKEVLDTASGELATLAATFKENIGLVKSLVEGIGLAVSLLGAGAVVLPVLAPLASPALTVAATAYLLLIATVVLTAMDYCDSGGILQRVRGIRSIAAGARA